MGARDFTMGDVLARNRHLFAGRPAFVAGGRTVTHGEHGLTVARQAAGLRDAGIGPGARIAVAAENALEFAELYGAAALIGAVVVPLNWRLSDGEIGAIIADCEPAAVVVDAAGAERIGGAGLSRGGAIPCYGIGVGADVEGIAPFARLAAAQPLADDIAVAGDDPAVMLYTAATDGRPKGAMLSHEGLIFATEPLLQMWDLTERDVNVGALPLFHLAGLTMMLGAQRAGGASVLLPRFSAEGVVAAVRDQGGSLLATFPPILDGVLDAAEPGTLEALRVVVGLDGAQTIDRLEREHTTATFWAMFGQSETSGFVTLSPHRDRPGSAGRPVPLARIALEGEAGEAVAPGGTGEILVRGPGVMLGYWRRPDESAGALRDGWLHTGDLGAFDADGYLWYKGRTAVKELIKSGGENVYPAEVEAAIAAHDAVAAVCVVGAPDATHGEAVHAVCVLREGRAATAEEIIDFVAGRIARFKKPRRVRFVEALPRSGDGTVDRAKVKEMAGGA